MKTLKLDVEQIHLDPANLRRHPDRNLAAIKASLARFGQQTPVVVDSEGIVRKGNGTVMAARELGWKTIEAVRTGLSGSELTGYAIADNRSSELAEWDTEALAATLRSLQSEDFPIAEVGFDAGELDALIESMAAKTVKDAGKAPAEFASFGETIATDYTCPKCGYAWSGKPQ